MLVHGFEMKSTSCACNMRAYSEGNNGNFELHW
ncbi:hypothetical protein HNQ88_001108 [Aureibacter tunicatorum]|uniref:Uncharacterized protein n=1 Tax=Aureibacter tunicatorum TaxID=866807 RepID=A0AAE3XKK3_9BACT|nr:hypothetical protein [Aureibacter tunicatorum]BDD03165.1 hypothetical protein AUTU_06480 [Aureibacter tunicatorum]